MRPSLKRIVLFGNHSCANRGDAAISRGLLEELRYLFPAAEMHFYTRYPGAANYVLGLESKVDPLALNNFRGSLSLLKKLLAKKIRPYYFLLRAKYRITFFDRWLSAEVRNFIWEIKNADAFFQVGGSFYVDVYGLTQFEGALIALSEGVPVYLVGHSVGPFGGKAYRYFSATVFNMCCALLLRESLSLKLMQMAGIPTDRVISSADTAWLAGYRKTSEVRSPPVLPNTVVITVRDLRPFDRRLGLSQAQYEDAIGDVVAELRKNNFSVVFASTCTGLDSYGKDDRIVALRIARQFANDAGVRVLMDELTDTELAAFYSKAELVVATRLHSAILAMREGCPAVALFYEHKSQGILEEMGLAELSLTLPQLTERKSFIIECAKNSKALKSTILPCVHKQRETAQRALRSLFMDAS